MASGVTKGGLFHHFTSKQALVDGVLSEMLANAEREIAVAMAANADPMRCTSYLLTSSGHPLATNLRSIPAFRRYELQLIIACNSDRVVY